MILVVCKLRRGSFCFCLPVQWAFSSLWMYALGTEVSSRAGRRGFRSGSMEQWGWILRAMKSLHLVHLLSPLLHPGFWTQAWAMLGSPKLQNLIGEVIQNKLDLDYGVPPLCQNTGLEKDLNLRPSPSCTESSRANKHVNQITASWPCKNQGGIICQITWAQVCPRGGRGEREPQGGVCTM